MYLETDAIVLSRRKITESDVSLVLFTRKAGKIQAIANGARNPRSRLMSVAHPFVYGEFSLNKGKDTWRLNQAQLIDSHYILREDLNRLALGSYFLELTEAVTQENQTNNRLFDLLLESLSLIKTLDKGYNRLRAAFELKVFLLSGIRARLDACVIGGEPYTGGDWFFSAAEGGLVCPDCCEGVETIEADGVFVRLLRFLSEAPLTTIMDTRISRSLMVKTIWLNRQYIRAHLTERPFKSLDLLKNEGSGGE
jgi:DNA repair protein RecO (recombination protein O)